MPIPISVARRLRNEDGFGLIELVTAMVILNIGLLALVAGFSSGALAIDRASQLSTASAVGDRHMELFRGILYTSIGLDAETTASVTTVDTRYGCDVVILIDSSQACTAGNRKAQAPEPAACMTTPLPDTCQPTRAVSGPDGKRYRIDTYIVTQTLTAPVARSVKVVSIVIRDDAAPDRILTRQQSTFDASTGT